MAAKTHLQGCLEISVPKDIRRFSSWGFLVDIALFWDVALRLLQMWHTSYILQVKQIQSAQQLVLLYWPTFCLYIKSCMVIHLIRLIYLSPSICVANETHVLYFFGTEVFSVATNALWGLTFWTLKPPNDYRNLPKRAPGALARSYLIIQGQS